VIRIEPQSVLDGGGTARTDSPFFLVGAQRSGTTMLRLMLNRHAAFAVPFESEFIPGFHARLSDYGDLRRPEDRRRMLDAIADTPFVQKGRLVPDKEAVLRRTGEGGYAELVDAVFSEYAVRQGKRRWGDKTPGYVTRLDLLWQLFPGCRIVHLVRDGRDVALSLRRVDWGSTHVPRVAEDWRWKTTLAHKMGRMLGDHYLEVRYEDLVSAPEIELRRICRFLGESYDPMMLRYPETARAEIPDDSMQWHATSVRAPDPEKAYAWKRSMSHADQVLFEHVAGDALARFGYERVHDRPTLRSRAKALYYTLLKRW
jgi:hypothetical protein